MGCHGGLSAANTLLAGSDPRMFDFAEAYAAQRAAVYVANTGFGYGDTVANALSERLMSIFGAQIGRNGTLGADWLRAMHKYYNTMGFYGVYDEKALSEATMYGLPSGRSAPRPGRRPTSCRRAATSRPSRSRSTRAPSASRCPARRLRGRPSTTSCSTRTTALCSPHVALDGTARDRPAPDPRRSSPRSTRTT